MSYKYLNLAGLTEVVRQVKNIIPTDYAWTITLSAANWVGASAPYTQSVNITGMLSTYIPQVSLIMSDTISTAKTQQEEYNKISRVDSSNGSVLFTCFDEKPTEDLTIRIESFTNITYNN